MKLKLTAFFLVLFTLSASQVVGADQDPKTDAALMSAFRSGVTYVPINRPESEEGKKYMQIIKDTWTASKIQFISYNDIPNLLKKDNFFLSFNLFERGFTPSVSGVSSSRPGDDFSVFTLNLWTCNDQYFKKMPKKTTFKDSNFDFTYRTSLANVILPPDYHLWSNHEDLFNLDYSGNGHLEGLGEGVFKNLLQHLQSTLDPALKATIIGSTKPDIKNLRTTTLYVPECVLEKNSLRNFGNKLDPEKVFKNYKLKYKLISTDELNKKIMNGEDFYYMLFVKGKTTHTTVYHSLTGQQLYYKKRETMMKLNLDDDDLGNLYDKVMKK